MGTNPATSFGAGADPRGEIAASPYFNPDLAPTSTAQRTWRLRDIAALWISMSACIPTYMLASSLIDEGMNWWQAVLTIFLGNVIVLGADDPERPRRHEVRHPLPRLLPRRVRHPRRQRAGAAPRARRLRLVRHPGVDRRLGHLQDPRQCTCRAWKGLPAHSYFGINLPQFLCFLFFWGINMLRHLPRHRLHPPAAQHQGAAADRPRPGASGLGVSGGGRLRADAAQPSQFDAGRAEGRRSSGASSSRR